MLRPTIHFQPLQHWMNDPNGLIFFEGYYHLFYQYNPHGDTWGNIHWGHAKSIDGVHWTHLPIALFPSLDHGEIHCFSGCCVLDPQGIPTILYTSIGRDEDGRDCFSGAQQWMAQSMDGLLTWTKPSFNPILTKEAHPGFIPTDWSDPYVWKDKASYWMTLGAGDKRFGYAYLYTSMDLKSWTYVSTMAKRDVPLIECPNLIDFGTKQILMYSPGTGVYAEVGLLKDGIFTAEQTHVVDYGHRANYYAAHTLQLPDRKIVFSWIPEDDRRSTEIKGYNGALAYPRVLTLVDDVPHYKPLESMESLRVSSTKMVNLSLETTTILRHQPRALELRFETDRADIVFINLLASPDGREMTTLIFDFEKGSFLLDRSLSSLSDKPEKSNLKAPITVEKNNSVIVYLDHSIIEVFINETTCLSARVYPTLPDSDGVALVGSGILNTFEMHVLSVL